MFWLMDIVRKHIIKSSWKLNEVDNNNFVYLFSLKMLRFSEVKINKIRGKQ